MNSVDRQFMFCRAWARGLLFSLCAALLALFTSNAPAATFYVNANGANPTLPYSDWSTAATNIQDAIDAASGGDLVLVTNGLYQYGGRAITNSGAATNRVTLNKPLSVQSVNGPFVTTIQGGGATNSANAVRCAWLTNGASLTGFTLQGGATITGSGTGGGVWCASSNSFVANCIIVSNTAYLYGGGAFQGTLNNCWIGYNSSTAVFSGAAADCVLDNCTVVSNSNVGTYFSGTGVALATNCIIYFNKNGDNYSGGSFSYCCTTPLPPGAGNITNAPQLLADDIHLANSSPCRGTGTNLVSGTDIFGQPWNNPPSMGCAEVVPQPVIVGPPTVQVTGTPVGYSIDVSVTGQEPFTCFWTVNDAPITNDGHYGSASTTNLTATGVSALDAGSYQVVVSNAFGMATSAVAQVVIHFVNATGLNPTAPYLSWDTSATNIQDAINASVAGDIVLVTNGIYASGGKSMDGTITNRVSLDRGILLLSASGATSTIIQGAWDPATTNGPGAAAIRCAWLTNNAILAGFTLRGGATRPGSGSPTPAMSGGGVWASSNTAVVANCIISGNAAGSFGGGAYQARLDSCVVIGNAAIGLAGSPPPGGYGGGAQSCILRNCTVTRNSAGYGGGAENCMSFGCAITTNWAMEVGGGCYLGTLVNCTVAENFGVSLSYQAAAGNATLTNCIVYGNINQIGGPTNYSGCTLAYCDTDPLPAGPGNIDMAPQLLADGVHLAPTSPCIGAGLCSAVSGTDIDGQPWNNPPSVGCDDWQPPPAIGVLPGYQVGVPARGLTFDVVPAGEPPFTCYWSKDGVQIQDGTHYSSSATPNLVVNNFGPADSGSYQVVVSNAFGLATGQVAQVVIHTVNGAGLNPTAPYSSWATAATNIQDAINAANIGDIVLVTNGFYATGGNVVDGGMPNRVALNKALTVISVNGFSATTIQGAQDPSTVNGPLAVRCAWVSDGAMLNGFTLQNGATLSSGVLSPQETGGAVCCSSTNGLVSNCVLTNNNAIYGAGIGYGTLINSLVVNNTARQYGGGAYYASLNNCTVVNNFLSYPYSGFGAGTYAGAIRNSIVIGNNDYDSIGIAVNIDNYATAPFPSYAYCDSYPLPNGVGDISANVNWLDWYHISSTSPCRGAGSSLYASGLDLDGEPWASPPSMGCAEVVPTNDVGPLGVTFQIQPFESVSQTFAVPGQMVGLFGQITGKALYVEWSFGDGPGTTNAGNTISHTWTSPGNYDVVFTAFNADNPGGVSTNVLFSVLPLVPVPLQSALIVGTNFHFSFASQTGATYVVQYATNFATPITWQSAQTFLFATGGVYQVTYPVIANGARFYRVITQ